MSLRSLLLIFPILLITGSVIGQKKKRKLPIREEIERFISDSKQVSSTSNKALLISLIDSSGVRHIDSVSAPDSLTFEIGDLTQIFTSLLVHELAGSGKLDLHKSINALLPFELQSIYFNKITLQDCLSHTTGLPRIPNNLGKKQIDHNQPFEHYQTSDLASFIQSWKPSNYKRDYQYSLIGYELIGIILDHQFSKSLDQLIKEVLYPVYGFATLSTDPAELNTKGSNKVGNSVEPMRFASFQASSGLKAKRADLELLLSNRDNTSNRSFIQSLKVHSATNIDDSVSIGSGWHQYKINRFHSFYLHKGSTKGFSSFMAYNPVSKTGVVILSSKKVNLGPMGYYIMGQLNNRWKK